MQENETKPTLMHHIKTVRESYPKRRVTYVLCKKVHPPVRGLSGEKYAVLRRLRLAQTVEQITFQRVQFF